MSLEQQWASRQIPDDVMLNRTDTIVGTRRGRNLLIITGSHLLQYVDYLEIANRPKTDTMIMNFGYLLPGAENFTWMFHGSIGYINTFKNCSTFKYFCNTFNGVHLFMVTTKHTAGQLYPIPQKDNVIQTIKNNKISRFQIMTHAYPKKGIGYVPTNISHYSPSKIPFGCGGTLGAMALPFAIQLGYDNIYLIGVGDIDLRHFYDLTFVQPHLHKPAILPHRKAIINRLQKLDALAKSNKTSLYVLPKKYTEANIQSVLTCIDKI